MVKTLSTNDNNDIFIGSDGNLAISTGQEAILLACQSAAEAQRGEMLYSINQGMPNFQIIWNGIPNLAQFEAALRNTLLSVSSVKEVTNLNTKISNNTLFYTAVILTDFGESLLNGEL